MKWWKRLKNPPVETFSEDTTYTTTIERVGFPHYPFLLKAELDITEFTYRHRVKMWFRYRYFPTTHYRISSVFTTRRGGEYQLTRLSPPLDSVEEGIEEHVREVAKRIISARTKKFLERL